MQSRRHRMRRQTRHESSRAWIGSGATVTVKTYARCYGVDRYTAIGFPLPDSPDGGRTDHLHSPARVAPPPREHS
jgi:hypothetical protein